MVLTGAGISAESGLPTFRGKDGLWNKHRVEDLATFEAFQRDPILFWEFYSWRRNILREVKPNLAHYALVDFENYFEDFHLVTQNVDNLHHIAGSKNVIELHGNITRTKCPECDELLEDKVSDEIPQCPKCNVPARPDVVLFGENLNHSLLSRAQQAASECEVFFSIGTSNLVEPAASLPYLAKANGAYLVEMNQEETPLSIHADETIRGKAGKTLPGLAILLDRIFSS